MPDSVLFFMNIHLVLSEWQNIFINQSCFNTIGSKYVALARLL